MVPPSTVRLMDHAVAPESVVLPLTLNVPRTTKLTMVPGGPEMTGAHSLKSYVTSASLGGGAGSYEAQSIAPVGSGPGLKGPGAGGRGPPRKRKLTRETKSRS